MDAGIGVAGPGNAASRGHAFPGPGRSAPGGTLDGAVLFVRLHRLIRKGQVRVRLDRRGVVTLYRQRAEVEPALYLALLAQAYARFLAAALAVVAGFLLVAERAPEGGLAAGAGAAVLYLGAWLARWRQERRWMAEVRRRLLEDPVFFAQAYEDGLFTLQRGRRRCRYPRPWQAILGLEDGAEDGDPAVRVRDPQGGAAPAGMGRAVP